MSGPLPAGINFSAAGVFSGNPGAGTEGTYVLMITGTSSSGGTLTQSFVLTVVHPILVTTAVDEDNSSIDPALGTGTSLREAINFANGQSVPQTINFSPNLAGQTINLTITGDPFSGGSAFKITNNITIVGLTGDSGITIRRANGGTLRIFRVTGTLTLSDLTLADASGQNYGGAIYSNGAVRLNRCTLRNNTATISGGALYGNSGPGMTLTNCTLVNNQAQFAGGGITSAVGLTLNNVTVTGNTVTMSTCCGAGKAGIHSTGYLFAVNTIVAGNIGVDNNGVYGVPSDVDATYFDPSTNHNLIGTGGSGGLVDGVNGNMVGVQNPGLGTRLQWRSDANHRAFARLARDQRRRFCLAA